MKQQNHKRSGIFLLEIMIAILFFALTGAVCLRTFVKAHTLSTQATETEQALSHLEDVAGLLNTIDAAELKDEKTFSEALESEFPACEMDGRNAVIYYDTDWKACLPEKAFYQIQLQTTDKEDSMCHFQIKALRLAESTASMSSSKSSEKQSGRAASEITHLTLKRYAKD